MNYREIAKKLLRKQVSEQQEEIMDLLRMNKKMKMIELSHATEMSQPLISYYVNGKVGEDSGLIPLGYVKKILNERQVVVGYELTKEGLETLKLIK